MASELDMTDGAALIPNQESNRGKVKPKGDLPSRRKSPKKVTPPKKPPTRVMR